MCCRCQRISRKRLKSTESCGGQKYGKKNIMFEISELIPSWLCWLIVILIMFDLGIAWKRALPGPLHLKYRISTHRSPCDLHWPVSAMKRSWHGQYGSSALNEEKTCIPTWTTNSSSHGLCRKNPWGLQTNTFKRGSWSLVAQKPAYPRASRRSTDPCFPPSPGANGSSCSKSIFKKNNW